MRNILIGICLLLSINVLAVEFTLQEVRYDNKTLYFFPKEAQSNPKECDGAIPFVLSEDQDGFYPIYSMSLVALTSGRKMQCWLSGCTDSVWGDSRPQVYACGLLAY